MLTHQVSSLYYVTLRPINLLLYNPPLWLYCFTRFKQDALARLPQRIAAHQPSFPRPTLILCFWRYQCIFFLIVLSDCPPHVLGVSLKQPPATSPDTPGLSRSPRTPRRFPNLLLKARVSWFKLETGVQAREMTYDAHGRVAKARAFTVNSLTLSLVAPLKCQI